MSVLTLDRDRVLDSLIAGAPRTAAAVGVELNLPCALVVLALNDLRAQGRVVRTTNARSVAYWAPV